MTGEALWWGSFKRRLREQWPESVPGERLVDFLAAVAFWPALRCFRGTFPPLIHPRFERIRDRGPEFPLPDQILKLLISSY